MEDKKLKNILKSPSPNAFICYNTEHILTSLILSYYHQNQTYIYICNRFSGYRKLTEKINKQFPYIEKAIAIDDNKLKEKNKSKNPFKHLYRLIFYKKYLKQVFGNKPYIKPLYSSDIFMYHDGQFLSQFIVTNFDNLNLIEEGIGNYADIESNFPALLKKLHGIHPPYGRNPRIKNIFVKKPEKLPKAIRTKGCYFDKSKYVQNIPEDLTQLLIHTFLDPGELKTTRGDSVLLITQPFSEDLVIEEFKKKALYSEIVDKLSQNFNIYLKPHPRETTNYSFLESRVERIFQNTFPIEIINYIDEINFDIAVTLSSSSIERLKPQIKTYKLGDILSDDEKYFRRIRKNLKRIKKI